MAGRVTTASVQTGNPVDGTTAPYVIDAANRYEVVGQLPERLVGTARPGMTVLIEPDIAGRVTAVGSTIDPATRSVVLKAEIPAGPGIIAGRATIRSEEHTSELQSLMRISYPVFCSKKKNKHLIPLTLQHIISSHST